MPNITEMTIVINADGTAAVRGIDGVDQSLRKTNATAKESNKVFEVSRRDFRGLTVDALSSAGAFNGMNGAGRLTGTVLQMVDTRALTAGTSFRTLGASIKATIASLGPIGIAITLVSLALQGLNMIGERNLKNAEKREAESKRLADAAVKRNKDIRAKKEKDLQKEEEEFKRRQDILKAEYKIEQEHYNAKTALRAKEIEMVKMAEYEWQKAIAEMNRPKTGLTADEQAALDGRMQFLDMMHGINMNANQRAQLALSESYLQQQDLTDAQFEQGRITAEERATALLAIEGKYQSALKRLKITQALDNTQMLTGQSAQTFAALAQQNKKFLGISKAAAIADIGVQATKAAWTVFGQNFWIGLAMAPLIAAKAAADIARVTSTSDGGIVSSGNNISVPTGGGASYPAAQERPADRSSTNNIYYFGSLWGTLEDAQKDALARGLLPALNKAAYDGVQ
jgi:hypothetical protein